MVRRWENAPQENETRKCISRVIPVSELAWHKVPRGTSAS